MSELLRARANELRDLLDEAKDTGSKLVLEGFLELIKESNYGEKEAKVFKNFTILDEGLRGLNGTTKQSNLITILAKIVTEEKGFVSFGNYKIDMGGGSYMRTGDFSFSPNKTGLSINIPAH